MLIDSHTHLEMAEFDEDRTDVLRRAREAGLTAMITVGTTLPDCGKVLALAEQHREVYAAIGIHPHEEKSIEEGTYDLLRGMATAKKVVAYGEIGLDFFRNRSPRPDQIRRFGEQLELATELGLPVIIHNREAHGETLEMLYARRGRLRGVIHCFSGDRAVAKKCLDLDYYISVPGTVTFAKAEELQKVVQYVPLDRVLVETDAPFLAPEPYRGKRNEPSYVAKTAEKVAELRGIATRDVALATSENAKNLFSLPDEVLAED